MNTTITKDQILLKDNEVYVIDKTALIWKSDWVYDSFMEIIWQAEHDSKASKQFLYKITHSTAKLDGVKQLPREWFVMGEDVEELADKAGWEYSTFDQAASAFSTGFKAGYNAKKGEFSREQMEKAFRSGWANSESINSSFELEDGFQWFLNSLQSLTLPQSLTLNKDNEIVKIEW